MADGHRRVPVQQQQRHRLADDVAPADHHGARAGDRNIRSLEQLDDARWRAGDERRAILHQPAHVQRMKPVDVLAGIQGIEHAAFGIRAHRLRQRRLHQDPVVHVAAVEPIDEREQLRERRRRGQPLEIDAKPHLAPGLRFAPDVDFRRRILADQHDPQAGRPARARPERLDARTDLRPNPVGDGDAVEQPGRHQRAVTGDDPPPRPRGASATPAGREPPACRPRESPRRAPG